MNPANGRQPPPSEGRGDMAGKYISPSFSAAKSTASPS
jgi:hypothetical protein